MPLHPTAPTEFDRDLEDAFRVRGYLGDRDFMVRRPLHGQVKHLGAPFPGYFHPAQYYASLGSVQPSYPTMTHPMGFAPYPGPFPTQSYPAAYPPYPTYHGQPTYRAPALGSSQSAYTELVPPDPPSLSSPISPPAVPSKSPRSPGSSSPPPVLSPSEFIRKLERILRNPYMPGPLGQFWIQGEPAPVSVSRPHQDGPFVVQHYSRDGGVDGVSVAHVLDIGEEGKRVIVWCPPPKMEYFGGA